MTAITSLLLSVLTFFASITGCLTYVCVPSGEPDDFTPVLRFVVASDSHVIYPGDYHCGRINKAIKAGYAIAEADSEYKELDAAVFAGDLTDNGLKIQFLGFQSAVDSVLKDDTALMAVIPEGHDCRSMGKEALGYYSALNGNDTDFHNVINGYHFIGISTCTTEGVLYNEAQRAWLSAQLSEAVADDPEKAIFLIHHEHVKDTVYGSSAVDGWGTDYFKDILEQYPQVVDFSGHSHYPLNDPRSIWQGAFTAVGTGTLDYFEFTVDGENCIHPSGNKKAAQIWVVEADANNRVRLRGFDLISETFLCEYIVEEPSNPDSFAYTEAKRTAASSAPAFASSASLKIRGLFGNYSVTVPAASSTDTMPVFLYRAYVLDENDNVVSDSFELSGYYFVPSPDKITIDLEKLEKGRYTIQVVAENAYGMISEPLAASFSVL